MVDLEWKSNRVNSEMPNKSPKLSDKLHVSVPTISLPCRVIDISAADASVCEAYDCFLRLPELRKLWSLKEFSGWKSESVFRPALQALEITFRFISTVLLDPRPYANRREWNRRLESLASAQVEIIAMLCVDDEDDAETRGQAPTVVPGDRNGSAALISEASLLPRLATWYKSKSIAQKILSTIDCEMSRCPYTLGLGELNVIGKPCLRYDAICKPLELHSLRKSPYDHVDNYENQTVYNSHQILESWIQVAHQLLDRITERIERKEFEKAANEAYMIERIWKLLTDIEDLHLLMDPNDFLKLKKQLAIKSSETVQFCFRSKGLVGLTKLCKDLRHKVPEILGVEVDPKGGPRVQEAAMKLYMDKSGQGDGFETVYLLQGLQAIESAMKRFFYAYKQMLVVVLGSLEAKGNRVGFNSDSSDSLGQIFLEPTYFPSLDAAKTFLGYFWDNENIGCSWDRKSAVWTK